MNEINRIKELAKILNNATYAYYQKDKPIMSDKEYDDLYDELEKLENETGLILANSPTQKVQGFILDGLQKVAHSKPMLSAAKTKSIDEIKTFVANKSFYVSYKLDGLTLVVTYDNGELYQVVSRGNGEIGEVLTLQARMIKNLPLKIQYKGRLELRGECVISWNDFRKINNELLEPYSHPRNLAAGSIRNLDTNIVKNRSLDFIVFECITDIGTDSKWDTLLRIGELGFMTVDRERGGTVENTTTTMLPEFYDYPVDGLIFELDDIKYSKYLGATGHHENCRIALKWADEVYETTLRDIEWSTSKTGLVNPVAIFDEIDLDGALTTRATLHNISYIEELQLGIGDVITVYRANMVIPKVHENLTCSNSFIIPDRCPCCGEKTEIHNENGSKTLHCTNLSCGAQLLGKFTHFVSRNAMNIDGLSEATLEKLIEMEWLNEFKDIYSLKDNSIEMKNLEGFGKRSVDKLLKAIEDSKDTTLDRFIYSLSIPLIGRTASKTITKYCKGDIALFLDCMSIPVDWTILNDFGYAMHQSLCDYTEGNLQMVNDLADILNIKLPESKAVSDKDLSGQVFVITGSLNHFENRDAMKEEIEGLGGKVSGSVSAKTSFLINNDVSSTTGKNKKAKELGVQIISENQLLEMIK